MELHREEKREKGYGGDQEKRGNQTGRDRSSGNQFPKCSPQPRTSIDSWSWVEKRRGREEIEVTWGRKRRVKRGREESSQ